MDKYEFQIKTEQLGKLVEKKDYRTAAKIADSIDWRRTRNVGLLMQISEVYENLERYEDSYEILNMAYDCAPIGRMIVYKMVEVAVKLGDFNEAVELYKEFVKIAPHDLGRYALKYEIYRGKESSLEDQIAILEEYKSREYLEPWAYELALLYYKAGMMSKCVEECDDLILWFSEGEYVVKAMELKRRIQPLTASQEEKYRQLMEGEQAEAIKVKPVRLDEFSTINLQEALAESLQDFIKEEQSQEESSRPIPPSPIPEDRTQPQQMEEEDTDIKKYAVTEAEELRTVTQAESKKDTKEPMMVMTADLPKSQELLDYLRNSRYETSEPEEVPPKVSRETGNLPHFLGQTETGQLTFDLEENVLERQITGQLTIEDVMEEWKKKQEKNAEAIAEAARRDEERRKEQERLRAAGQLPDLNTRVESSLPEDVQRLIDEIEGKLPVKIHVEPILREAGEEQALAAASQGVCKVVQPKSTEEPSVPDIPSNQKKEPAAQSQLTLEGVELPNGMDDVLEILKAEESELQVQDSEPVEEPVQEEQPEEATSPMVEDLEKALEAEISSIPTGQLTEEQKKLFAYFTSVRGMKKQLAELLTEDRMRTTRREDSLVGNIVVTGESGNGKTTLAGDLVKALQKQRRIKGAKMARVGADSVNGKNVSALIAKLGGGALLIEKAGNLKTETAVQLSHAMTRKTGGLLVILEDEKEEIRKLFIRCESLGAKFTRTIEIPTFTNKELVAFGESYAEEKECVLDEMAVLALYNRIGNNQTSDHLVNVAEVKDMVDEAIERSQKGGFFKLRKSRTDEFGHTVLREKDFEK